DFLGFVSLQQTVVRGKKTTVETPAREVPKSPVNRNSGAHPLLAFDDAKYLFGPGPWTKDRQEEDHEEKHQAFVELIRESARETEDEGLAACCRFYDRPDEVAKARTAFDTKVTGGVLISVANQGAVIDREAVRAYWREHFHRRSDERNESGGRAMCMISGKVGPVAPTHDKVKGAARLGGQAAGVALMSFDKEAFRSYGWEKNENSPVSPERARAYVLALNDLMSGFQRSRVDHAGLGFLYWTKQPVLDDPIAILESADPGEVARVLKMERASLPSSDPNEFYLIGVNGNGGRMVVRHWMRNSLNDVLRNVGAWFADIRMVSVFQGGAVGDPPKFWQVLRTLARDGEPPPDRVVQLLRRALYGIPIGRTILAGAMQRLRGAQGSDRVDAVRVGLIRMAVNDQIQGGEGTVSECLDDGLNHAAYLCGRLLALYDGLQYQAQGEVGVTVADRYFSLASTNPSIAFPKIVDLGEKHLRKLRRDNRAAAIAIERELQTVMGQLAGQEARFPGQLSLEDQGRFAIGFHQQRAASMARARDRKEKKGEE
ncbi:MAG: type I-C CRISPR-associated protein Cas8c/Csd1, partial [Bryobacterales bacterium]|nr:type I-C CRISPR-associated protein Cas8c/Csd1 [Bryobacterales bacterium]